MNSDDASELYDDKEYDEMESSKLAKFLSLSA